MWKRESVSRVHEGSQGPDKHSKAEWGIWRINALWKQKVTSEDPYSYRGNSFETTIVNY